MTGHRKMVEMMDVLRQEVHQKNKLRAGGGQAHGSSTDIRLLLRDGRTLLQALQSQLSELEAHSSCPSGERVRRRALLMAVQRDFARLEADVSFRGDTARRGADGKLSSMSGAGAGQRHTEQGEGVDLSLEVLQQRVRSQDEVLEVLSQSFRRSKDTAVALGEELDGHNRLLDDLDRRTERTDTRMQALTHKTSWLMRNASSPWGMCVMIVVLAGALTLLLLFLFHIL